MVWPSIFFEESDFFHFNSAPHDPRWEELSKDALLAWTLTLCSTFSSQEVPAFVLFPPPRKVLKGRCTQGPQRKLLSLRGGWGQGCVEGGRLSCFNCAGCFNFFPSYIDPFHDEDIMTEPWLSICSSQTYERDSSKLAESK